MIKNARSEYFSQLISKNKKNPKVLFDTIVSPAASPIPVFSTMDSNHFAKFFVDKIRDINTNISPEPFCPANDTPPSFTWSSSSH